MRQTILVRALTRVALLSCGVIFLSQAASAQAPCRGQALTAEIYCSYQHSGQSPISRTVFVTLGQFGRNGILPASISESVSLTPGLKAWVSLTGSANCSATNPSEFDVWLVQAKTNVPLIASTHDTYAAADSIPHGAPSGLYSRSSAGGQIPPNAQLGCKVTFNLG